MRRPSQAQPKAASPGTPAGAAGPTGATVESQSGSREYLGEFTSTSYGPPWGGINGPGEATACGVHIGGESPAAYGVAAGASLPCGTVLEINPTPFGGKGTFVVWDRGGAIGDRNIDFYDWRGRAEQLRWGRRTVKVTRIGHIDLPADAVDVNRELGLIHPIGADDAVAGAIDKVTSVTLDPLKALIAFMARLFEPSFWLRVGKALLGAVALVIGTGILAKAMLGVDLGIGERTVRAAAARRYPHEGMSAPTDRERASGRRALDRVKGDHPSIGSQAPLDEPPF